MAQTQGVIFDMDGVLTDSEPVINEAAIRGLREYGIDPVPDDFTPFVGTGEDRYIGGVAEKYGLEYKPEMKERVYEIYLEMVPEILQPFEGVHELIEALRNEGVTLAVASSADNVKVHANLKAIALDPQLFQAMVTGEDVQRKKPDPQLFLTAAERLGIPPGKCCVVEDAVNGVTAAKRAGMRCVAVAQSFDMASLEEAEPDAVRSDIASVQVQDLAVAE